MSVATMNPSAVPLPPHHINHRHSGCQTTTSSSLAVDKPKYSSPHPHAHGSYRRRLMSPISPLSTTYNTRSFNKTKDEIIAECDREVQWSFEQEYGQTIEKYMKECEDRCLPLAEMMDLQPELEWYMLPFLVDFIIEVHTQFRMSPYTLHLTINIVNRYVSKRVVFKKHYQLVGCAALWIAAKFEDAKDKVPTVRELMNMCVNAYDEDMFVQMEGHMLATLGWEIGGVQTCEVFVDHQISRLRGQHGHVDCRLIHLARFFLDLTLFGREFLAFKPSEIATASVALARHILGSQQFVQQRYTEREVDCVELLLSKIPTASQILRRKYAYKRSCNVTSIIDDFLAQAERRELQHPTPPSSSQSQCPSLRMAEVKTPDLHIQLPDTPPHTPVTASTVPQVQKSGYFVSGAGLPTPPADDDNKQSGHHLANEFSRGTYGRSESFIVDSRVEAPVIQDEDMETDYDSEDDDMEYEEDYESDAEEGDDNMVMDPVMSSRYQDHYHESAPRIALAHV